MKKSVYIGAFIILAVLMFATVPVLAFDSGGTPGMIGEDTIVWTGHGVKDGMLENVECPSTDTLPAGINPNNYLHWVLTTDGGTASSVTLNLGGSGSGSYGGTPKGGMFHFYTPYSNLATLTAYAVINVTETGGGPWNLNISHGCAGYENLDVEKTVDTSYTRTHDWSIDKSVNPTDLYLYIPGQGEGKPSSGTATWTIDVTYEGYLDSDFVVSGNIYIENTGTLDAVITDVADSLVAPYCGVEFPYTLPVGESLTCSYYYGSYTTDDYNTATVTTQRATYTDKEPIVWGDPTTEYNETVDVYDDSDLFGEVKLGTLTAPNSGSFTYDKTFYWTEYKDAACGDHSYDNTASVVGDSGVLDDDSDTLYVHVQCHIYETAYGKGTASTCFIPTFSNWGWTNYLAGNGSYTFDLWAAAGQCSTNNGTLVGTVTVVYGSTGYVSVTYNVSDPYVIQSTHVYAGYTKFQKVGKGFTVAPGQYTNVGPFTGPIYVIAHAVVGIPDPNFP